MFSGKMPDLSEKIDQLELPGNDLASFSILASLFCLPRIESRCLWNHCLRLIEKGDKAFEKYQNGSAAGKKEFEMIVLEMNELIQPPSEFSATVRACFRGSSSKWVREIA
jgi:hypothetical protein